MENWRSCTQCSEDRYLQDDCNNWAIAMAYVPWQNMNQVYEPAQALRAGTLFPELEKPFCDTMRRGVRR